MSKGHVLNNLQQSMVPTSVPCAMTLTTWHVAAPGTDHPAVLYRTITPYNLYGWKLALSSSGLTCSFPNLVHDMTYRAPIGNPPPLTHTFIPHNLKSADIDPSYMDNFIQEELTAGHFDGPFSVEEAHEIFGGHFCMAPLGFVEKPGLSLLRLFHHHSKENKFGHSTNEWLYPSLDATRFYTAADAADLVSNVHI